MSAGSLAGEPAAPTFPIIGVAESGTTTLHNALGEHPEVFVSPIEETNFFAWDPARPGNATRFPIRTREEYLGLFAGGWGYAARGESSPLYLDREGTAERIAAALPEVRLIAILRNPADRAYSAYRMGLRQRGRPLSPETDFADDADRLREDSRFLRGGFYFERLQPYLRRFPRERLRLALFDELLQHARGLLRELYAYLGVDPGFRPPTPVHYDFGGERRRSALARLARASRLGPLLRRSFPALRGLLSGARGLAVAPPAALPARIRRRLAEVYREDVGELGRLMGRNLSAWLDPMRRGEVPPRG